MNALASLTMLAIVLVCVVGVTALVVLLVSWAMQHSVGWRRAAEEWQRAAEGWQATAEKWQKIAKKREGSVDE